jgi:hypothetical protein
MLQSKSIFKNLGNSPSSEVYELLSIIEKYILEQDIEAFKDVLFYALLDTQDAPQQKSSLADMYEFFSHVRAWEIQRQERSVGNDAI